MAHNRQSLNRTVEAEYFPVTLDHVKTFCALEDSFTDHDAMLMGFIRTAIAKAENYTRRALITQTWKLTMDRFPQPYRCKAPLSDGVYDLPVDYADMGGDYFELYKLPVQSITSIVTYNSANTSATLSSSAYRLDAAGGRVYLNSGYTWPSDLRNQAAIEVTYVAGYGDNPHHVPEEIRTAILSYVNDLYRTRGGCDMSDASKTLLDNYRLMDRLGASQR
jgi:hypothetical protein